MQEDWVGSQRPQWTVAFEKKKEKKKKKDCTIIWNVRLG
jgi:hypothetical protein